MPNPQTRYAADFAARLRQAIAAIPAAQRGDIYALSLWFYCEEDDERYPCILFSYNTETHYRRQIARASGASEARWNFAFWLQEEAPASVTLGGENDAALAQWFAASPYHFSDADHEAALGAAFCAEFIETVINTMRQLFADGTIAGAFGRDIPAIIHELEYYAVPNSWTKHANPKGFGMGKFCLGSLKTRLGFSGYLLMPMPLDKIPQPATIAPLVQPPSKEKS